MSCATTPFFPNDLRVYVVEYLSKKQSSVIAHSYGLHGPNLKRLQYIFFRGRTDKSLIMYLEVMELH